MSFRTKPTEEGVSRGHLEPDTLKTVGDIRGSPAQQMASSHSCHFALRCPRGWAIQFPAPPPLPTQTHPTHPRHMDTVPLLPGSGIDEHLATASPKSPNKQTALVIFILRNCWVLLLFWILLIYFFKSFVSLRKRWGGAQTACLSCLTVLRTPHPGPSPQEAAWASPWL